MFHQIFRPFLKHQVDEQLTTPYVALLDILSAITFVIIPIAWLPLILLFAVLAVFDRILSRYEAVYYSQMGEYKGTDFDIEVCHLHSFL